MWCCACMSIGCVWAIPTNSSVFEVCFDLVERCGDPVAVCTWHIAGKMSSL